jgi:hypothetical protein
VIIGGTEHPPQGFAGRIRRPTSFGFSMRAPRAFIALLAFGALLLGACGDDNSDEVPMTGNRPTTTVEETTTTTVAETTTTTVAGG